MEFSLFPPLEALQAAEFQIARQRRLDSPPNPVFFECVSMFLQWFPSKHGTLHFCRHKTGRKHHVRQCFQFPYLPNRWKYRYLQCFLQFFHVPMPVANSNIYIYIYIYKKSFQNIVFDSVFPMFPVKQTVIYTFFAIKAVNPSKHCFWQCFCNASSQAYGNLHVFCYNVSPKHLFLQCFQCSGIQKPCKILLCTMFFSFLAVFPLPESYQNDPKFHFNTLLRSDTPKIFEKCRKHHRILVSVRNRFWPPPAKADIATAILTNVIEHLVLLFCPPISTPSPPKRCGRILKGRLPRVLTHTIKWWLSNEWFMSQWNAWMGFQHFHEQCRFIN